MIKTVLFDLDGTLLPMDQDQFLQAYLGSLCKTLAPHGYQPEKLIKAIWASTGAVIQNDGRMKNEDLFWARFSGIYGDDVRKDEPLFYDFYLTEFQKVKYACGFQEKAAHVIDFLKSRGIQLILATNPLFPAVATHSRIRWAGLQPEDFQWITTYENARFCKPNKAYFQELIDTFNLDVSQCLMVGNDAVEDTPAKETGMEVFLLTDCLINKDGRDISQYPQGGFDELLAYLQEHV